MAVLEHMKSGQTVICLVNQNFELVFIINFLANLVE